MLNQLTLIKNKLDKAMDQLCENAWMFVKRPGKDFTRNRKLSFRKMISFMLAMEGKTLTKEMMNYFGCSVDTASTSAFVQQRGKICPEAFSTLFELFVSSTDAPKFYKGLRLLAADGSAVHIPTNPTDSGSYFPGANGQKSYNLLHLNAMYDLLQRTYVDALIQKRHCIDECRALADMIDRSDIRQPSLIIADRGYESYNIMAHVQEKGWYFLIRIRDVGSKHGLVSGLTLPCEDVFDFPVQRFLTRKQTKDILQLSKNSNAYRWLPSNTVFDYLPEKNGRYEPAVFYKLSFRIVRFKITDDTYETVITNLPSATFDADELKTLYNMRWGIETSFRDLKYTVGLLNFHAKKVEYIYQEIFALLIMYNFSELITSHVVISKVNAKHAYKANFAVSVHICRQFFRGNVSPPDVEALIQKNISPIRPGRNRLRNSTTKHAVSFSYRVT